MIFIFVSALSYTSIHSAPLAHYVPAHSTTPSEKTCSETKRFALLCDSMPAQFVFTPHSLTYFLRLPNVSGTAEREFKRKTFQNWGYEISTALSCNGFLMSLGKAQKLSRSCLIKFQRDDSLCDVLQPAMVLLFRLLLKERLAIASQLVHQISRTVYVRLKTQYVLYYKLQTC